MVWNQSNEFLGAVFVADGGGGGDEDVLVDGQHHADAPLAEEPVLRGEGLVLVDVEAGLARALDAVREGVGAPHAASAEARAEVEEEKARVEVRADLAEAQARDGAEARDDGGVVFALDDVTVLEVRLDAHRVRVERGPGAAFRRVQEVVARLRGRGLFGRGLRLRFVGVRKGCREQQPEERRREGTTPHPSDPTANPPRVPTTKVSRV